MINTTFEVNGTRYTVKDYDLENNLALVLNHDTNEETWINSSAIIDGPEDDVDYAASGYPALEDDYTPRPWWQFWKKGS